MIFFLNLSKRHKGCQIDYLIQTKYNSLDLCEIKFSKGKIGMDVVKEVQEKILRLGIIDFGELLVF